MSESPASAIHHMTVLTIDFTLVLCRLDDIEKKFAGTDKATSACITTPPRQGTTANRGSMSSRGHSSWPGRGAQSTRGRGAFQNRQEQAPPATPPPSPRLASQNDRLPTRGQIFFRGRGRGRGSACWVCQRQRCYSWNHQPLENREPPTPPPQDDRTPLRRTTSPRSRCYVCGTYGCHSDFHRGDARDIYVPPPFQPSQIQLPITELSLGRRTGSGPLRPKGKSQSTQTWKPTNNQVAQTLITGSSDIAPTAESKLSSFVELLTESTSDEQVVVVSLFPARTIESNASIVNATIRNVSCRMLMDTGGLVSVLPLSLCQKLKPPLNLPVPTREVATYGNNTVKFHGPVPLHVQLCGLTILHPFYIVDDSKAGLAPAIGGYDLMKSGRMILDIDNQLLWSRLTHSLTEQPSPNPTTSIPNTNVRSVVCFAELPPREVPSEPDAVDPDLASVAPVRSSVLCRQVKTVLPPVGLRVPVFRPALSPSAPVFCPRADRLPPTGTTTKSPTAFRVPVVECDDILTKTHVGPSHMFSMESTDLTVPMHLQDLFDKSVAQGDLAPTHQCNLAALLRRHGDAFATGPMDLWYCSVLEHDIDTGNAEPIRQPPRRPPLSARQAEENILNEMLQTGVIEPSNSHWSSPVCIIRKKDGSYRYVDASAIAG